MPEIGKALRLSSAHSRYVFYVRLSLRGRSPALPRPFRRTNVILPFPISGAKVLLFFDMTKFFVKKIAHTPYFRIILNKKRGAN